MSVFFKLATFITKVLFEQFLICTATYWVEHMQLTTKHNGYFTFNKLLSYLLPLSKWYVLRYGYYGYMHMMTMATQPLN